MKKTNIPMRVFSVSGISRSGKTSLVVELTKELTKRGYSVGTVKSIGCGRGCIAHRNGLCDGKNHHPQYGFTIDTEGKNSFKHREAGAKLTTTWAKGETALLYPYQMELGEIIDKYDYDFLIVEGGRRYPLPKITTGQSIEDTKKRMTATTIAISGKVADQIEELDGIKCFKTFSDIEKLADLVEEKVYPALAFKDYLGCKLCGDSCQGLAQAIYKGEKSYKDCKRAYPDIILENQDKELHEKLRKLLVQLDEKYFKEKIEIKFK